MMLDLVSATVGVVVLPRCLYDAYCKIADSLRIGDCTKATQLVDAIDALGLEVGFPDL